MSYNGTVQCRECYQTGHNKRTCPDYTERLKSSAQRELDGGQGLEGYWGRQYAKRTGKFVDGTSAAEHKSGRRDAGMKRRCTFCAKQGHNRRSCDSLMTASVDYAHKMVDFRTRIVADMRERGLGIGALVLQERWNEKYLSLIDVIVWDQITHRMGNNDILQGIRCGASGRRWAGGYPESDFNSHSYHQTDVVGPVGSDAIFPPEDFFSHDVAIKSAKVFLKDQQSEDYHDNLYTYG